MKFLNTFHHNILHFLSSKNNRNSFTNTLAELLAFGYKQSLSCVFPVFIFSMLAISKFQSWMPRYDFLLFVCLLMQFLMYWADLESKNEVLVICLFHFLGVLMEWYKVYHGSWTYPEEAWTKIWGVPLYSGFMYASVASYLCQAWKHFDLKITNYPPKWLSYPMAAAIYLNFFSNAYIIDVRWWLVGILILIFRKTDVYYTPIKKIRVMPLILSFLLIGFFIWLAENIATFLGAWKYAHQHTGWQMVKWHKLSSWSLLVIVSVIIVAELKRFKHELMEK